MCTVSYSLCPKEPWKINECLLTDSSTEDSKIKVLKQIWQDTSVVPEELCPRANQGFILKVRSSSSGKSLLSYSFVIFI